MSAATLVVRGIGELVTGDPARGEAPGVVHGGAVAASGETIVYVGSERGLAGVEVAADATVLDAAGDAVVPGLVDAHSHAVWLGDRAAEYAQRAAGADGEAIAASGGGIAATVRATEAGSVEQLVAAARPRLARALAAGTTTIEVKTGYGHGVEAEERQLAAIGRLAADPGLPAVVATSLPLHGVPPGDRARHVDEAVTRVVPRAAGRARFVDAFCDRGAFTVEECERLLNAGMAAGMRAKLHAEQRANTGGCRLAARCGAVSADHLEHATDDDLRALAAAGVVAVLLPGASLVTGGPPPPGRRALDSGARVAVATDCNPGTCYSESMPLMVSLAVALAGLTPAQALLAATAGGAAALALGDRGMLRSGMRCDLAVLDSPRWLDIAYHLGGGVVRRVVRGGRVVA